MQTHEYVAAGAQAAGFLAKMRMAIGLAILLTGVLIAVFPQILVILLASLVISTGLGTFLSGWRMHGRAKQVANRSGFVEARRID